MFVCERIGGHQAIYIHTTPPDYVLYTIYTLEPLGRAKRIQEFEEFTSCSRVSKAYRKISRDTMLR